MPPGEMCPCGGHFWVWLVAHGEVVGLLVILGPSRSERCGSVRRVITKHALCCGLEISVIAAQFVVSVDLVQSVLITEVFILSETCVVSLCVEFVCLFCCEVLAPTSRVVPMMMLEHILHSLINDHTVLNGIRLRHKRSIITALIAGLQLTYSEVCLAHLLLLSTYIEHAPALWSVLEAFLGC